MKLKMKSNNKPDKLWIFGKHAVISALESTKRIVFSLMLTNGAYEELKSAAMLPKTGVEIVDISRISSIIGKGAVHQGYAALVSSVQKIDVKTLLKTLKDKKRSMIIALDQITDPNNVGSIIRSAVAFGADAIITTKDNAVIDSPSLAKASSGGIEDIEVATVSNLVMSLKQFREAGYWVIGMDANTKATINKIVEYDKVVIVMGSEGEGLRRLTIENCDLILKIPMTAKMESLNVSNAAAIAMFCHSVE
jgi:23S rRNA (guanosine2251-2'-O)-methyltransferase